MSISIKLVSSENEWTKMVDEQASNSLLQSWAWHDFSVRQGMKAFPVGVYDGEKLVGGALTVKVTSKRANYLVTHGGPILNWNEPGHFLALHKYLLDLSRNEKVDFFRIRPLLIHDDVYINRLTDNGYNLAPMYFPAEHTLILDLNPNEEDLMGQMRKQTRYYVRQAIKNQVEIKLSQSDDDLDAFYELYTQTYERQHFTPYTKKYFQDQFQVFKEHNKADLILGYHNNQLLVGAMVLYSGQTAYYFHGASKITKPDVYAPYLVQWQAILRAKEKGYKKYDFWGVAPNDNPKHPKAGLSTFKRGFGGEPVRYLHTMDYPVTWKYWPMYLYVKWERWRKHL